MRPIVGRYVVYGVGAYGSVQWMIDDVQLDYSSDRKGLRAYREARRDKGKKVSEIDEDQLADELVVIFGPELSPKQAVATLEKLAAHIKESGLIIGRGKPEEDVFFQEKLDGKIIHR